MGGGVVLGYVLLNGNRLASRTTGMGGGGGVQSGQAPRGLCLEAGLVHMVQGLQEG